MNAIQVIEKARKEFIGLGKSQPTVSPAYLKRRKAGPFKWSHWKGRPSRIPWMCWGYTNSVWMKKAVFLVWTERNCASAVKREKSKRSMPDDRVE